MSPDTPYESIWTHLQTVAFRQDWIDAGGVATRYVQAGPKDAPAVIMLHGTGGTWEAYMANLGPHSQRFNCFALDFLGSGYSDKPSRDYEIADYVDQIAAFMNAVGVKQASLIGISLGAWVALRFASTHPDKTLKVTLNAPFGLADDAEEIGGIIARRGRAYDDPSWENIKAIFSSLIYRDEKRIDDLIALRQATYRQPDAKAAADHVLALLGPKYLQRNLITEDECRAIKAPVLVVESLKDRPLFLNTARRLLQLLPNSTALQLDNVGHWPQFESPDEFNSENIKFLLQD
ncbi:alpha/beta hydrolase [Bradyrhizobium sp. KBS0727]|uniref:alpha/beta fold hydrolase n=1 Tax=unclassified Bradyrhizobium TaxID=2631580 RepID=UPI00110E2DC4|nr:MULTISPECIES: alpha/beta hydrolase [unclassified Bradyrhizobium]QDW40550.1 alpha/beta hydrolase [Bradyrhizobium sp. KBS0725]QDW47155.1 alpha/beta hydrolase [Bradyrhizobium sp. KBS0727]